MSRKTEKILPYGSLTSLEIRAGTRRGGPADLGGTSSVPLWPGKWGAVCQQCDTIQHNFLENAKCTQLFFLKSLRFVSYGQYNWFIICTYIINIMIIFFCCRVLYKNNSIKEFVSVFAQLLTYKHTHYMTIHIINTCKLLNPSKLN